jgi:methylphosphotriester-DNA--protein-cysteine methyltransferase
VYTRSDGNLEFWLERSDPLLNTILPGTGVSVVVNLGSEWAAGLTPFSCAPVPTVAVYGPMTRSRMLIIGREITAIGAAFNAVFCRSLLGIDAAALIDRIVPLADVWPDRYVDRVLAAASSSTRPVLALRRALLEASMPPAVDDAIGVRATTHIKRERGIVSVADVAIACGTTRQHLTRSFHASIGLTPKQFARLTRFQSLVQMLLSVDREAWARAATDAGFYDQAHMINEFRTFTGASPTAFFKPRTMDPQGDATRNTETGLG